MDVHGEGAATEGGFREREGYHGWAVLDASGSRAGRVDELYEDAAGRPRYIGMRAGLFGGSQTLLPADLVTIDEDAQEIRTPWSKDRIKGAPRHDGDEPISSELQRMVYEHLGRRTGSGEETDDAMTRSEEELTVAKRERAYGSARLRKRIEMDEVSQSVPVYADFVEVDEIEITDPESDSGQVETTADGDVSVPVFAERLVVVKEQVVVKRVVLRRERELMREETVSDVVRREVVDLEIDRPGAADALHASGGEDLSRGPTPETRHPEGGRDDVRDTTQGPTPEIRRVMRLEDESSTAAAQPSADRRTREDRGGPQDALDRSDIADHETVEAERQDVVVREEGGLDPNR
jgi:uncharacterized protein (TIGR02271 family)